MNANPEARNDWLATKLGGVPKTQYEFEDRAHIVHSHWMVGYDDLEIAAFLQRCGFPDITEIDVAADLQYIRSNMTARQILTQCNDRERIRLYRSKSRSYDRLLGESLIMSAKEYVESGLSPVPALKEYRQAVGMEEKPGGLNISISSTKQTANINTAGIHHANYGGGGRVKSFEDLVRCIIEADPSCGLQPVIDTEAHEALPPSQEEVDDAPEGTDNDQ